MTTQDIAGDFNIGSELDKIPDAAVAPDGPYVLEIKKAEAKSAKTGNPMIAITCSITNGPFAGMPVWNNFVWVADKQNVQRMFKDNIKRLGVNITPTTTMAQVAQALVGRVFQATLGHREYQGTMSNTLERIGALQGTGPSATPVPGIPTPQISPIAPAAAPIPATPADDVVPVTVAEDAPQPGPTPPPAAVGPKPPF